MPFGIPPRPGRYVEVSGDTGWTEIDPPTSGERIWVETANQQTGEGRVIAWDRHRLAFRTASRRVVRPRWADIRRVVFLDRPRG